MPRLGNLYRDLIYNQRREVPFWMLVGFLPTFIIARVLVHSDPKLFLAVHGTHVHHFTYGIFILAIIGYVGLIWPGRLRRFLGLIYGIGLGLAADEFGMWLRLTDEYGRGGSYDGIIVTGGFLLLVVYLVDLLRAVRRWYYRGEVEKNRPAK